jgi:hypothetical protein
MWEWVLLEFFFFLFAMRHFDWPITFIIEIIIIIIIIIKRKLWRLLKIEVSIGGWSALYPIVAPLEVQAKGEKLLGKAKGIKV